MKSYYRIMLGRKSVYAEECRAGNFIGANYEILEDLTGKLPDESREFNRRYIPVFLATHPGKSRVGAGLSCGFLWTIAKGIQTGDIVLCPDGQGRYWVGEVVGPYAYASGTNLPHRRPVRWYDKQIDRSEMSEELRNSTGSIGTVSTVSQYANEIDRLIGGGRPLPTAGGEEDPASFALERHLEDFLVENWRQTELGSGYDIYEEEGQRVGQQYPTDTGPIDVLAVSKDRKRLLVVELKRGRASDVVVGQILRYMGFVQDELAEPGQTVEGVIIALDDDQRVRRALSMVPNIRFFRYKVTFQLIANTTTDGRTRPSDS